jgi:septum formation protein
MTHTQSILTLASQSPRRKELLAPLAASLGYTLRLLPPDAEEDAEALEVVLPNEDPKEYVCRVTNLKAEAGWQRLLRKGFEPSPLLASDTTVVLGDEILGKPTDAHDARRMLRALSNRTHHVLTAVTLLAPGWAPDETQQRDAHQDIHQRFLQRQALSISEVHFGHLSDNWIEQVIASGEPMDKAGAYAIQGRAAARIKEIKGSPSGVMGLPLYETQELLSVLVRFPG